MSPTDPRDLIQRLADELQGYQVAHPNHEMLVLAEARAYLATPGPSSGPLLIWSEERQPCEDCRYNHHVAETPFGRIVISWKGWKDHPLITPDEKPWEDDWFPVWNSVKEAKAACEAEYGRRLLLALGGQSHQPSAHPEPAAGPTDEDQIV